MTYVIRRVEDNKFLRQHPAEGTGSIWTDRLQNAHAFTSREAAQKELCVENEYIQSIEEAMRGG